MSLSIPDVPSYTDFTTSFTELGYPPGRNNSPAVHQQTLDTTSELLKEAKQGWETLSKMDADLARCHGCEEWWRASVKNVLRACITAGIAVATVKKGIDQAGNRELKDVLEVCLGASEESYHSWWIIPKISIR